MTPAVLGERIHVVGNSNAGKTTLASRLSERRALLAAMTDPRWRHIRFMRLTSTREVEQLVAWLEAGFTR